MGAVLAFPLLIVVLGVYNIVAFTDFDSLSQPAFGLALVSGTLQLTWGDLIVLAGLMVLLIEVLKAVQAGRPGLLDHVVAMAVLVAAAAELVLVDRAATATFLTVTAMCLVDVVAGIAASLRPRRGQLALSGG